MSIAAVRREQTAEVIVDERGLRLPSSARGVVTVAFDGRYVWSFQPERDSEGPQRDFVPWPESLRPRLRGTTRLAVTQLSNGSDEEVTWLDGDEFQFEFRGHPAIYRYWDATDSVRFMYRMADETLRHDLHGEVEFLGSTVSEDSTTEFTFRGGGGIDFYLTPSVLLYTEATYLLLTGDFDGDGFIPLVFGAQYRF